MRSGFTWISPYTLRPGTTNARVRLPFHVTPSLAASGGVGRPRRAFLSTPGLAWSRIERYWNINQLSIDYASRPRLRSRLTLGGRAFPRNPWTFGGRDSHSPFATHAGIRTREASTAGFRRRFAGNTTLPYRSNLRWIPQLRR